MLLGNLKKVLFIGAHCDDIEIGCGGTICKMISNKIEVHGLIITDTHYVRDVYNESNGKIEEKILREGSIAQQETLNAAKELGYILAKKESFLIPHYEVRPTKELESDISNYIQKHKIDAVFTHWHEDLSTPDHSEVGIATLRAARCCKNLFMYNSSLDPAPDFRPNLAIDISSDFEKKEKVLRLYASEVARKGKDAEGKDLFIESVKSYNKWNGQLHACEYAESFLGIKACLLEQHIKNKEALCIR